MSHLEHPADDPTAPGIWIAPRVMMVTWHGHQLRIDKGTTVRDGNELVAAFPSAFVRPRVNEWKCRLCATVTDHPLCPEHRPAPRRLPTLPPLPGRRRAGR